MSTWPWPGDSALARARRVAHAYREHLATARPDLVAILDQTMRGYGEHWVAPSTVLHDLDDWLTPAEAALEAAMGVDGIRSLRHRGRLTGTLTADGWRYRYRDVLAAMQTTRTRKAR